MQLVAKDSSGRGNDLPLVSAPLRRDVTIQQVGAQPLVIIVCLRTLCLQIP